jgi:hypothetical protein
MKYKLVAVGGTFDRFHKGHESLLLTAFHSGDRVIIGITSDSMVKGKVLANTIEPYQIRCDAVQKFLIGKKLLGRAELVEIQDPYGPVLRRPDIEAVVVGPKFSKEAVKKLKKHTHIIHCPTVFTQTGRYLSSTSIRLGRVTRTGAVYRFPSHTLILSEKGRTILKKPLGILFKTLSPKFKNPQFLISVGDDTTYELLSKNIVPHLAIVDFKVQRKKKYTSFTQLGFSSYHLAATIRNPAGSLTPTLARAVARTTKKHFVANSQTEIIRVLGEEDLATLLCILFAPLTSIVIYGQPNEGSVIVEVTEKKKEEIAKLLTTFTHT